MSTSCVVARLVVWLREDGNKWLAWCPRIDVITQSSTKQEALEALKEAVSLWFESCIDRNVLEDALEEVGLKKISYVTEEDIKKPSEFVFLMREEQVKEENLSTSGSLVVTIPAHIASNQLKLGRGIHEAR